MILLSGHSLTQARRVPVEALSLNLKERESTAAMTPADMTGIGTESWFLDDVNPGGGIVWRVKSIEQAFATDTPTVHLEHVINTLRDRILFGEITPADISGNPSAEKCSAEQTVRYILSRQSDWRLGSFGYNVSNPYKFDGDTLYDALVKVSNSLDECWWSFDMSQYPFVLNIIQKPAGVTCEMRAGRNLTAITKIVDKSGMYTRFYPIGKDDLHISTEYVSRNENLYGIISKVEVDPSKETEEELRRWADERLKKHAEPTVTVTAEGFELADATGESLDRLTLGRLCRIPLTEFNTTIEERIVELNYPDKAHNPENVQITLANNQDDLAAIIADTINNGGGSSGSFGRAGARQQKEDHAWIEDTEDHVALCAEGIIGTDASGNPNWYLLSQIVVDGKGIHQSVEEIKDENVVRDTKIEQNEKSIILEATEREKGEAALSSRITVEADRITQEVEDRKSGDNSVIKQTSTMIALSVAAGQSSLYKSVIQVTSTAISLAVASGQSSVYNSVIKVTSTNIALAVASGQSSLYKSVIQVTSTAITLAVASGQTSLYSSVIKVTSTNIALAVASGQTSLYSSVINVTSTAITLAVASGQSSLYNSVIKVTSTNIALAVSSGQTSLYTSVINVTSTAITLAVASGQSSVYNSVINVTSTNIALAVSSAQTSLYTSVINVTSTSISLAVASGQSSIYNSVIAVTSTNIVLAVSDGMTGVYNSVIAVTSTSIALKADKIDLQGFVTMSNFNSLKGHVDNLTGGTIVESFCKASLVVGTTVTANNTFIHSGDTIYKRAMRLGDNTSLATVLATGDTTSISIDHSHAMSVDSSGNVTVGQSQTTQGTFNIADTSFYKAHVASAWNAGGQTAQFDQQSQWAPYGGSVTIKALYLDSNQELHETGRSITIWNSNCSHTFGEGTFNSNGTFYPNTYGYSGYNKVIVSVRTDAHNNCAANLTKYGTQAILYVPDSSGVTVTTKLKNISAASRCWYYGSDQTLFTAYT